MSLKLLKDDFSVIYKRVFPVIQVGFLIMLFVRSLLDNTKYEILCIRILVILGLVLSGLMGTRELYIKGNKWLALFYYLLGISYVIFMIYNLLV